MYTPCVKKFYANCVLAHVSTWEREIICMWMLSPIDSWGNNYQPLMFISCCLFVSNTIYLEDGPNDICSLTCEIISCCLTLSFEVLSIFYVHTCSLLLMSSESLFLELVSGEMSPWIVSESESCLWIWSLSCSFVLTSLALWSGKERYTFVPIEIADWLVYMISISFWACFNWASSVMCKISNVCRMYSVEGPNSWCQPSNSPPVWILTWKRNW